MNANSVSVKSTVIGLLIIASIQMSHAQMINGDLHELRKKWGYWDFARANTARFTPYMGRSQKRTMLYMNLARQDGKKFTELVINPYVEKHPEHKEFSIHLKNKEKPMLYPSLRLWLAALPHAIISGTVGSEGHQGFTPRMKVTFNWNTTGENCSYGYFKGIDVTLQLLNSTGHRANIMNDEFARAAVSKFPHIRHGWNSVTSFSGPKFFDLTFRKFDNVRHIQANIEYSSDFKQSILDLSLGMRYNNNVNSARWSLGAEIILNNGSTVVGPKIHWATEYYYVAFGSDFLSFFVPEGTVFICRPLLSFRFPFSFTNGYVRYMDLGKSKSSIGISYGYNINMDNRIPNPLNAHQVMITYTRNFHFRE